MSDLSRMLDDLYALPDSDGDGDGSFADVADLADATPTRAPSWSSEEALDEVFSSWVPGSTEGTTAFERSMATEAPAAEVHHDLDGWLAETEPEPVPEPEPVLVAAGLHRWSPSDDDILPARRRGRRR